MINTTNFVYSKAAAAIILGINVYAIARFEIWYKVCFVVVKGQRPTFISKKAFRQHFADWRIEQSKWLCVAQVNREHYRVVNPKKNSVYSVWAMTDGFDCECEDYKNQILIFGNGKACCKHALYNPAFLTKRRSLNSKSLPHLGLSLVFTPSRKEQCVVRVPTYIRIN